MSTNKATHVEDTISYRNYLCKTTLCVKTTTLSNRFNASFCARWRPQNKPWYMKFKSDVLKQIWVGFLRVRFYHLASTRLPVWKTIPSFEFVYISCFLYIRLLWSISISTKYLSRWKKVYIKVFLNQYTLILIICYL